MNIDYILGILSKEWFLIGYIGFLFGMGFGIAAQITWWLFDFLKNITNTPLG